MEKLEEKSFKQALLARTWAGSPAYAASTHAVPESEAEGASGPTYSASARPLETAGFWSCRQVVQLLTIAIALYENVRGATERDKHGIMHRPAFEAGNLSIDLWENARRRRTTWKSLATISSWPWSRACQSMQAVFAVISSARCSSKAMLRMPARLWHPMTNQLRKRPWSLREIRSRDFEWGAVEIPSAEMDREIERGGLKGFSDQNWLNMHERKRKTWFIRHSVDRFKAVLNGQALWRGYVWICCGPCNWRIGMKDIQDMRGLTNK